MRASLPLLLGLSLTAASPAFAEDPGSPSSSKECAGCHVRWVQTFFSGGTRSDYMTRPAPGAEADEKMCFSCHDGSMEDSRARMLRGEGHEVGKPPPAGMQLPEDFPLDEAGKLTCATCHTPHEISRKQVEEEGETFFMRSSIRGSAMCRQCHDDRTGGPDAGNHPIGEKLSAPVQGRSTVQCESCHTVHGAPASPMLQRTATSTSLCLDCHEDRVPHGARGRTGGGHPVDVTPETVKPSAALKDKGAVFGPQGQVVCRSCHKVHDASDTRHMLVDTAQGGHLCQQCHQDRAQLIGTKHDLSSSRPDVRNLVGETAVEGGACSACHLPHANARSTDASLPWETGICLSCHGAGGIAAGLRTTGYHHPLGQETEDGGVMTCASCHNVHRPAAADAADGEPESFLRQPRSQLCQTCHSEQREVLQTRHGNLVDAGLPDNVDGLSPAQSGPCLACHEVHSALPYQRFSRLLPSEGGDVVGRLCLSCHQTGDIAERATLTEVNHPTAVAPATRGIDTDLPLEKIPGHRARDAMMTCASCHDPHKWSPSGIADQAPFDTAGDASTSFLRVDNSGDSSLCRSCHEDEARVEGTDHDLHVNAPDAVNVLGQTVTEAGTCSACHVPHKATQQVDLWAREPLDKGAADRVSTYCLSCHSKRGAAADKIPPALRHPDVDIMDLGTAARGEGFPVFDPDTGRHVRSGRMSCPSCHQPHRWSAQRDEPGTGQPVEGDATNSFLRSTSDQLPCGDCHGNDSIYVYQHFHDPAVRSERNR